MPEQARVPWYVVYEKQGLPEQKRFTYRMRPPKPPEHTCRTCPYYEDRSAGRLRDLGSGRLLGARSTCRRFPAWVDRELDDWCGEHPLVAQAIAEGRWTRQKHSREELFDIEEVTSDPEEGAEGEVEPVADK